MLTAPSMSYVTTLPYAAIPLLSAQLKKAGYEVFSRDLSIEFFRDISTPKAIKKSYNKIIKIKKKTKTANNEEFQKLKQIYSYLLGTFREKRATKAYQKKVLLGFTLYPYKHKANIANANGKFNINSIYEYCANKDINFYITYLEEKIKKLPNSYDIICLSKIPDYDLNGILTLARLLKRKYKDKKIIIGGYWFSSIIEELKNHPRFFDDFCHFVMTGDGENALVELVKHLNGELDIMEVSNVMYKNEKNEIIHNKKSSQININELEFPDYSDYDFSNYESESPMISMFFSKGCYWGKCKFCTYNNGKNFQIKTIDNAIKEIKLYTENYGIKHIHFCDDAIKPQYYNKLANAIIKNNIKITFESFAILDDDFSYEILKNCKDAGLSKLVWGLETNSKKVFDIANKSGCFDKRSEILMNSHNAGIYNQVNVIEGLPGENIEDLIQTVKFIHDNLEYIDTLSIQKFQLRVGSEFCDKAEEYGLIKKGKNDFSLYYKFDYQDSNLTEENSFINFLGTPTNNSTTYDKDFLREATKKYLEKFAPELL